VPTVDSLEDHLGGIIDGTFESLRGAGPTRRVGRLSCEGSGSIGQGTALRCDWLSADPDGSSGPVFVAVLDDTGRYTFSSRLSSRGLTAQIAVPSDYPVGTVSCTTLMATPPRVERVGVDQGLDYTTVLHYWMSLGSPDSMDDDRDGLPCETVYPAEVVARVASSPLVPRPADPDRRVTREEVRAHAEAVLAGLGIPGPLVEGSGRDWGQAPVTQPAECGGQAAAVAGSTLYCEDWQTDYGIRQGSGVLISVLDDTGRYTYAMGMCCGEGPGVGDYPPGSTCRQLAQPPRDGPLEYPTGPPVWSQGLDYQALVFAWMLQGRPPDWDTDGDGRPCEEAFPPEAVDGVFTSTLRP
jgi:hypothetical protein